MIDIELLRKLIEYDPATGELRWLPRPESMFSRRRLWMTWNTRYAGKPALTVVDSTGYKYGRLFDRKCYAHRVAIALMTGEWPEEVDHIDGDRSNNLASNLRPVSHKVNQRNIKLGTRNTSGAIGVYLSRGKKWCAQISVDGKRRSLGYFASKEEAIAARKAADKLYGFHENHGRGA